MIATLPQTDSLAELLHRLGDVPPERILSRPAPGMALPTDVLRLCEGEPKCLCELVDGTIVTKACQHLESRLTVKLASSVLGFLDDNNLGIVSGPDGPFMLAPDLIRLPDMAFVPWDNIPYDAAPDTQIPDWVPSLAVEVISPGNTRGELKRKLKDYFAAGAELVWCLYPIERVVRVYTSEEDCQTLADADELDGGDVLPGFKVSVRELFDAGQLRRPV